MVAASLSGAKAVMVVPAALSVRWQRFSTMLLRADCFDAANADFFFNKMSFSFGTGMCYITGAHAHCHHHCSALHPVWLCSQLTQHLQGHARFRVAAQATQAPLALPHMQTAAGTNVMIRARAAFGVSRYAKTGFQSETGHNQIYSEDEISEDIELGARIHAAGYKSVFIPRKLASGEVRDSHPSTSSLLPLGLPGGTFGINACAVRLLSVNARPHTEQPAV
jgi:hypothetical protein